MNDNVQHELPPLRDVIATHGLAAKKSLGQNFLLDSNLTNRIAREAAELASEAGRLFEDTLVIEVGPGPGGLTRSILSQTNAKRLISIEMDTRCIAALKEIEEHFNNAAKYERFLVIEDDALKNNLVDIFKKYGEGCKHVSVVANLPYNISTVLLTGWLKEIYDGEISVGCLTLMFQKEVVNRIVAKHATSAYGRLSILSQWICQARALFDVNPKAFTPPPKVTSTVAGLVPHKDVDFDADFKTLERVTAAAFGQRRKMLRSSLKSLGVDTAKMCEYAGVLPTQRAEEISLDSFLAMAKFVKGEG
jgi:16S rRNA (adenine1518-N6/adenine1519-N6)-dimethyltransferase